MTEIIRNDYCTKLNQMVSEIYQNIDVYDYPYLYRGVLTGFGEPKFEFKSQEDSNKFKHRHFDTSYGVVLNSHGICDMIMVSDIYGDELINIKYVSTATIINIYNSIKNKIKFK